MTDEALEESTCIPDLALHAYEALESRMVSSDEYNSEDVRRLALLKTSDNSGLKIFDNEPAMRIKKI